MKFLRWCRGVLWDVWNVFFPTEKWIEEGKRELDELRRKHEAEE